MLNDKDMFIETHGLHYGNNSTKEHERNITLSGYDGY